MNCPVNLLPATGKGAGSVLLVAAALFALVMAMKAAKASTATAKAN